MSELPRSSWEGVLTEEAVRRALEPQGKLLTRLTFAPGTRLRASALERRVVLLAGRCRFEAGGAQVELSRGEQTTLPAGPYTLEVLGEQGVELLIAFALPAAVLERTRR